MGLQGEIRGADSARAALIVGGIAMALGGAALFAIIAHTRTPWSTQRVVGLVPLESLSPVDFVIRKPGTEPKAKASQLAAAPVSAPLPAPPGSLSEGESVVTLPKPVEARPAETEAMDSRTAEMKILALKFPSVTPVPAAKPADIVEAPQTVAASVEPSRIEPAPTRTIEAKRVEPKPPTPKVAEVKRVEAKRIESKRSKPVEIAQNEPRWILPKATETKRIESKPVTLKASDAKRVAPKPSPTKVADARRPKMTPVSLKPAEAKRPEPRPVPSWINEAKQAQAKRAEARRLAEVNEAKLAEAKREAQIQAEQWKLAETKREVEATLAEAKAAQARLDESKHAFEARLADAKPAIRPAVETRTVCDSCGTVTAVLTRQLDRGMYGTEVRVHFGTGGNRSFVYPTDPGFSSGDRVRFYDGRLTHM